MPAKPTKIELILKLLRRPNGASITQLQRIVGWQPHSLRAALTGSHESPGIFEVMAVLGRDETIARVADAAGRAYHRRLV